MRVVLQRVLNADVKIDGKITGKINRGYVLLVGFTHDDTTEDIKSVSKKIVNLRIFEDENEKMNYDLNSVKGEILSISQFTLYAKLDGRRPSFTNAMAFEQASKMYDLFNEELRSYNIKVATGIFGADMKINLVNDGPVTILIDSKEK